MPSPAICPRERVRVRSLIIPDSNHAKAEQAKPFANGIYKSARNLPIARELPLPE